MLSFCRSIASCRSSHDRHPIERANASRSPCSLFLPCSSRGWGLRGLAEETTRRFIGPNWACFAADARGVGGFDVRLGLGSALNATGEETDMQDRLLAAGLSMIFVPDAKLSHHVPKKYNRHKHHN